MSTLESTCLCVRLVLNLKNIFCHVLIVVVFKYIQNVNCFTIILICIAVTNSNSTSSMRSAGRFTVSVLNITCF